MGPKLIWAILMKNGTDTYRPNHLEVMFYMSQMFFVLGLLEKQKKETHPSYYLEFTKRNPVNQIFLKGTYTKEGYRSVLEV